METLSDSIQKAVTATGGSSIEVITIPSTYTDPAKIHALAVDDETGEAFGTEVNLINDGSEVLSVFINTVEESNNLSAQQTMPLHTWHWNLWCNQHSGSTVITFHPSVTNDVNVVANIAQLRSSFWWNWWIPNFES